MLLACPGRVFVEIGGCGTNVRSTIALYAYSNLFTPLARGLSHALGQGWDEG